MGVHDPFEALSRVLEQYDARGWPIEGVEATTSEAGCLGVTIDVPVSLPEGDDRGLFVPEAATVSESGGVLVEWAPSDRPLPGTTDPAVSTVERSARLTDDGEVRLALDLVIDPGHDERMERCEPNGGDAEHRSNGPRPADSGRSDAEALAAVRDETVPPYDDTPYLERLYETCDTFEEMSRLIEMDVSAETVRRYMIEADLHEPESYDGGVEEEATAEDAPSEVLPEEHLLTDGFGLPEDVSREELVSAVVESKTVYEVGQALGIDQPRSRDLLRNLDLLDLVRRRIGDDPDRSPSREQVAARIRRSARDAAIEGSVS